MARWEQLIAARERLHLSQEEVAEHLGVGVASYQRWERGTHWPQPRHMHALCELFDLRLTCDEQPASQPAPFVAGRIWRSSSSAVREHEWEAPALSAVRLAAQLWSLVPNARAVGEGRQAAIRQVLADYDSVNGDASNGRSIRQEAISMLATLPLVTCGLAFPTGEYGGVRCGRTLTQCAASLEACWELHERGEASELQLGFQCTSRYLDALKCVSRDSQPYRERALRLATQYALLKTLFGWHCVGAPVAVQYAREALALSQEIDDLPLQLSAYSKLAWAYAYTCEKDGGQALAAASAAQQALERFERQAGAEVLPPGVRGGVYSTLAMAQARSGRPSDRALAMAMERDPGTEVHAYIDFTRATMLLEAGRVYYDQGQHVQAMRVLAQRVDPETLASRLPEVTAVGRVETLNLLVLSSLQARERDLERTIHTWQAAQQGAQALQSDLLLCIACATYERLAAAWPREARVQALRDHLLWGETPGRAGDR